MPRARVRQARRELRRLCRSEPGGGLAEVAGARGADAIDAGPELRDVQVQLEDAALRQDALHLPGEDRLLRLAPRVARWRQPQVLHELLGDGGRAARHLAIAERVLERVL